jgi:hypothetical protein
MGYAVDAFGRRRLLMIFGGLMGLCMWIIGALGKPHELHPHEDESEDSC